MTELATDAFRTVGPSDAVPDGSVVPYYLDDRKLRDLDRARRRPPLRVRRPLHVRRRAVPALRRPAHRDDGHVPMPRLPVRHRRPAP